MGRPGYVYLLRLEQDKDVTKCMYKIGKTSDLQNRRKLLGVLMPYPVTLVWAINSEDMDWTERFVHEQLKEHRAHGEWFALDSDSIKTFVAVSLLYMRGITEVDEDTAEMLEMFATGQMHYDFFQSIMDMTLRSPDTEE